MSHGPCPEEEVVVVAAAHQTQRWVQDRISQEVEVAEGAAAVGILTYQAAAAAVEVGEVGVGAEARLCLQQPRMQAGLEAFGHCPMGFDHV